MTCQIGSEESAEHERQHRRHETVDSFSTFLIGYDSPPRVGGSDPEVGRGHVLEGVVFRRSCGSDGLVERRGGR